MAKRISKEAQRELELADLRKQAAEGRALCWPTEPEPKPIDIRAAMEKMRHGGAVQGFYRGGEKGWSQSFRHGWGAYDVSGYQSASQGTGTLYATVAEAILAERWATCRRSAAELAAIDAKYAEARKAEQEKTPC